ncbi:MAG: hypothetical protein PHT37_04400 [Candidatus Cloacimonetes bacterium]|jgi:hypothetical protein|nr:hypothetical protein [Candidatus Cloacimonadota bacterium]MDD4277114.1 hypothetical protein [Candidatus Cloacimonadota bacterium]MDY0325805.1 hypothetical protein [Candidatus Cloacimonadaceae bacterium]
MNKIKQSSLPFYMMIIVTFYDLYGIRIVRQTNTGLLSFLWSSYQAANSGLAPDDRVYSLLDAQG